MRTCNVKKSNNCGGTVSHGKYQSADSIDPNHRTCRHNFLKSGLICCPLGLSNLQANWLDYHDLPDSGSYNSHIVVPSPQEWLRGKASAVATLSDYAKTIRDKLSTPLRPGAIETSNKRACVVAHFDLEESKWAQLSYEDRWGERALTGFLKDHDGTHGKNKTGCFVPHLHIFGIQTHSNRGITALLKRTLEDHTDSDGVVKLQLLPGYRPRDPTRHMEYLHSGKGRQVVFDSFHWWKRSGDVAGYTGDDDQETATEEHDPETADSPDEVYEDPDNGGTTPDDDPDDGERNKEVDQTTGSDTQHIERNMSEDDDTTDGTGSSDGGGQSDGGDNGGHTSSVGCTDTGENKGKHPCTPEKATKTGPENQRTPKKRPRLEERQLRGKRRIDFDDDNAECNTSSGGAGRGGGRGGGGERVGVRQLSFDRPHITRSTARDNRLRQAQTQVRLINDLVMLPDNRATTVTEFETFLNNTGILSEPQHENETDADYEQRIATQTVFMQTSTKFEKIVKKALQYKFDKDRTMKMTDMFHKLKNNKHIEYWFPKTEYLDIESSTLTILHFLCSQETHNSRHDMWEILIQLRNVIDRNNEKFNFFLFHGPPNSGKTKIATSLLELTEWTATAGNWVRANNFPLGDCIRSRIILGNEIKIDEMQAELALQALEGANFYVNVKNESQQMFTRTPFLLTSNFPLWHLCPQRRNAIVKRGYLMSCHQDDEFAFTMQKKIHPLGWQRLYELLDMDIEREESMRDLQSTLDEMYNDAHRMIEFHKKQKTKNAPVYTLQCEESVSDLLATFDSDNENE